MKSSILQIFVLIKLLKCFTKTSFIRSIILLLFSLVIAKNSAGQELFKDSSELLSTIEELGLKFDSASSQLTKELYGIDKKIDLSDKYQLKYGFRTSIKYGRDFLRLSEFECADSCFFLTLKYANALGKKEPVALNAAKFFQGLSWMLQDKYNQAIPYFYDVLSFYEEVKDTMSKISVTNNILIIHNELDEYKKAIKLANKVISSTTMIDKYPESGNLFLSVGNAYLRIEEFGKALEMYSRAEQISVKQENDNLKTDVYESLAMAHASMNHVDQATEYFEKALSVALLTQNKRNLCELYLSYGKFLLKNTDNIKGYKYCLKASEIAKEIKNNTALYKCLYSMSEYHRSIGNYQKALELYKECTIHKEKIVNLDNIETLKLQRQKHKYAQQLDKNELMLKEELIATEKKNKQVQVLTILLISLLLISSLIYYFLRRLNKNIRKHSLEISQTNQDLKKANELIQEQNVELTSSYHLLKTDLRSKLLVLAEENNQAKQLEKVVVESKLTPREKQEIMRAIENKYNKKLIDKLEEQFLGLNDQFINKILKLHPDLTANNIRLLLFIKMGLSNKEIAQLKFTSPESVKVAKSRLRIKILKANNDDATLFKYLNSIGDLS